MPLGTHRSASGSARLSVALVGIIALLAIAPSVSAAADAPPALQATLACTPAGEPGRVRCEVEAQVPGAQIKWADAEILQVPEMITPLKGRIGPRDAAVKEPQLWRLSLALVAKRTGEGPVVVRVRVVACQTVEGKERCVPLAVEATGRVKVGA